jgi:hypothetical protein
MKHPHKPAWQKTRSWLVLVLLTTAIHSALPANASGFSETKMTFAGPELMRNLVGTGSLEKTLDVFMYTNNEIWKLLVSELNLHEAHATHSLEDSNKLKHYMGWYLTHSAVLAREDISILQFSQLLNHFEKIRKGFSLVHTSDANLDAENYASVMLYEKTLIREYQSIDLGQKRRHLVDLMKAHSSENQALIEDGLRFIAHGLNNTYLGSIDGVPKEYKWLVGLGEMVADFDHEATRGFTRETLLNLYLDMYLKVIPTLTSAEDEGKAPKNDIYHSKMWIYTLVIVPVSHIVSLRHHAPTASKRAERILKNIKQSSSSKFLVRRTKNTLGAVAPNAFNSCQTLIRNLKLRLIGAAG